MTLIDAVESGAERLRQAGVSFGHGTSNAFDEAAWLVLWRLGLPLDELDAVATRELSAEQQRAVQGLLDERIRTRMPAAYLTGEAWLQGVPFYADARAIVPRSLIAELIGDGTLDAWLGDGAHDVLDLCTGSGSLAVLAALAWPDVHVDASDVSADALTLAQVNVRRHGLGERITLHHADGLQGLSCLYGLILCNPPYVNAARMASLPAEHRHEPALALAGGADGMDLIRKIVRGAAERLGDDGALVLEIGNERENFERAFPRLEAIWLETSAGSDQVLLLTREALIA